MAYSFPWNNAVPAGTDPANQLDTYITDLKSALSERLEDKFISSMTADPWVVKPEILGNVTGKELYVDFTAFQFPEINSLEIHEDEIVTPDAGGSHFVGQAAVPLPIGCVIQELRAIFKGNGSSASTVVLIYSDYATTPAFTQVGTILSRTTHAYAEETSLAINHTVAAGRLYKVRVDLHDNITSNAGLVGVLIKYDTPDCRNTR